MSPPRIKVPFITLVPLVREVKEEVLPAFADVLDGCAFIGGERVAAVEAVLAAKLGVAHAVACASGTDGLVLALRGLGVGPGMKVALPDLTFWATYEAVEAVGAVPVLVDIDPDDLQMSFDAFVAAHDRLRFEAAILVHLYGWCSARLDDFRALCRARGIALVEDAAQAFGVRWRGAPVLAGAAAAALSFHPAKVIGGAMDGGAVLLADAAIAARVRALGNHGRAGHYSYAHVGMSSRMGGLQAAYLTAVLARSEPIVASRREAAAYYRRALAGAAGGRLRVLGPPPGAEENGYLNVLTSLGDDLPGEALAAALAARGIGSARTYPEPISAQPPAAARAIAGGPLVESARLCRRVVNLPLYYGIAREDLALAAEATLAAIGGGLT